MITEETFEIKNPKTKDIRRYCFVCTGNTCRSPMAEALLNHYGNSFGIFAFSRGVAAEIGAPISENAAKALEKAGISMPPHAAAQFEEADFDKCDGVFAIGPSHLSALVMAFPRYAGKIRLLGDIPDPYGRELSVYEDTLCQIKKNLTDFFPYIFENEN